MKTKVYSHELPVTQQDRKFYHVIAKITASYDASDLARARIYRIKHEGEGHYFVDMKPKSGRIYKAVGNFPSEAKAREYIEKCLVHFSAEMRREVNESIARSIEKAKTNNVSKQSHIDAVMDYILDNEREDFYENPSAHHVYFSAVAATQGHDEAMKRYNEATREHEA